MTQERPKYIKHIFSLALAAVVTVSTAAEMIAVNYMQQNNNAHIVLDDVAKEEVNMRSGKQDKVIQAQVDSLLKEAQMLGADLKQNSLYGWVLCRKLRASGANFDESDYWELKKLVDRKKVEVRKSRFDYRLPYRPAPTAKDDGISGGDIYPFMTEEVKERVGIFVSEGTQGIQICGRTKAGKTSAIFQLVRQLVSLGLPAFIIDKKGKEFDTLMRLFPGRVLKAVVGKDAFFNPLPTRKNCSIFVYWYERHDSGTVLSEALDLFSRRQHLTSEVAPTLSGLIELVAEVRSPQGIPSLSTALKRSLLTVLLSIKSGPLGVSTTVQKGWDLCEIIKRGLIAIVDVSSLSATDEQYIVTALLSEVRGIVESTPSIKSIHGGKTIFVVDEAMNLVDKKCDYGRHHSPFSELVTLVRGSEIILILGYHSIKNVSDIVRSNSYMTISASLINGGDVQAVKDAAFLSNAQAEALIHLPIGIAMMKMAGRFTHPFLITWEPIPQYPALSQREIDDNNERILSTLPKIIPVRTRSHVTVSDAPEAANVPQNDPDKTYLLKHLPEFPCLNATERADAVDLPSGKNLTYTELKTMLDELRGLGFCDSMSVRMNTQGRDPEFWFLTDAGHRIIGSTVTPMRGGTSYAHLFLQRLICNLLKERRIHTQVEATL